MLKPLHQFNHNYCIYKEDNVCEKKVLHHADRVCLDTDLSSVQYSVTDCHARFYVRPCNDCESR